jgi:phytanoyl-CoA hydroxylase
MSFSISFAQLQSDQRAQDWARNHIHNAGFLVVTDFWNTEAIKSAAAETASLIEAYQPRNLHIFSTLTPEQHKEKYFMESANDIRFFLEANAVDAHGNLIHPKELAINKIGHALHILNPTFKALTFSAATHFLTRDILQMENAVIPQSMLICKPPHIGGAVKPHQDSTYMHTSPDSLTGFWIPLEDATQENCCLWAIPGSHQGQLLQKLEWDEITQTCQYKYSREKKEITAEYIPIEMKAGSVLLFKGKLLHASKHNFSGKSRLAYSFHMYDAAKSHYDPKNWLQNRDGFPGFTNNN